MPYLRLNWDNKLCLKANVDSVFFTTNMHTDSVSHMKNRYLRTPKFLEQHFVCSFKQCCFLSSSIPVKTSVGHLSVYMGEESIRLNILALWLPCHIFLIMRWSEICEAENPVSFCFVTKTKTNLQRFINNNWISVFFIAS